MSVVLEAWIATPEGTVRAAQIRRTDDPGSYEFCDTSETPAPLGLGTSCWKTRRGAHRAAMARLKAESELLASEYRQTRDPDIAERFCAVCAAWCVLNDREILSGPPLPDWTPEPLDMRLPRPGGPGDPVDTFF